MSITSATALPATSVDTARLGIVTSTPTGATTDEPGRGSAYVPSTLAAGKLVHCHPTRDNVFLCAFSSIWNAATPDAANPGAFTAHTAVSRPIFWWIGTDSGKTSPAVDRSGTPGYLYSTQLSVLIAGASNGGMVYYLVIINGMPALLAYSTDKGVVTFVSSSWVLYSNPVDANGNTLEQVVWSKGLFQHGAYLYVVGEQASTHNLFLCKKDLARGVTYFLGAKGWSTDPGTLSAMLDSTGAVMTSLGPVSLATFQDDWFMTTTAKPSANIIASFYRARHPLSGWTSISRTVDLGTVGSAAISGVFFQQGVPVSSAYSVLAGTDKAAAIAYTYTVDAATTLRTYWDALPVPRLRV